jgi:hypothetical protein
LRRLGERLRAGCQAVAAGYDGGDEADFLIVAPVPPPGAPPALSAFLRGSGRRALLFAALQAGDGASADAALAAALSRFVAGADGSPMGRWPPAFWKQLLAALPRPRADEAPVLAAAAGPGLEALPAPGTGARVAMLLALVAGLDEEDGGAALGVDAATWQLALRRAAPHDAEGRFDEAAWRALAIAVRDAQRALPEARLAWWERACDAALAAAWHPAVAAGGIDARTSAAVPPSRRRVALLWAGVGACALALAATFVPWPALFARGAAEPASAAAVPLDADGAPAARYDDAFALEHHPDLPRLLAGDEALLRDFDFGAWYAAQRDATPAPAPASADPYAPQPLPAPDALSPAQRAQLDARVAADAALPPMARGALRERWDAWQRLPAAERSAVRAALIAFAALPADARQAQRDAFAEQPGDLQHGWLLGPALGAAWPRLEPLLQQVPAGERERLLERLRAMDPAALDALAVLAQRTPPQAREALRQRLVSGSAAR